VRRGLGCRRREVIGHVKEDDVDRACSTHWGKNAYKILWEMKKEIDY
jgi:hypothetical protein